MRWQRRPARRVTRTALQAMVSGTLLFAAVGSCTMPQPHFPSIGAASADRAASADWVASADRAAGADGAGAAGPSRTSVPAAPAPREPTTPPGGHRPFGIDT